MRVQAVRQATPGVTGSSRARVPILSPVAEILVIGLQESFLKNPIKNVIGVRSTYRPRGLVHRCRLRSSWRCRSRQWLGCSSIKDLHELGSERRDPNDNLFRQQGDKDSSVVSPRSVDCLRVWFPEYERNGEPAPLVYRLCKASPGSHAPKDKT